MPRPTSERNSRRVRETIGVSSIGVEKRQPSHQATLPELPPQSQTRQEAGERREENGGRRAETAYIPSFHPPSSIFHPPSSSLRPPPSVLLLPRRVPVSFFDERSC